MEINVTFSILSLIISFLLFLNSLQIKKLQKKCIEEEFDDHNKIILKKYKKEFPKNNSNEKYEWS